jgi:hypothetical protein
MPPLDSFPSQGHLPLILFTLVLLSGLALGGLLTLCTPQIQEGSGLQELPCD